MSAHVALLPNDLWQMLSSSNNGRAPVNFIRLPHPRTGIPALFIPSQQAREDMDSGSGAGGDCLLELQQVTPSNPRSWFVGDEVISDGNLTFLMPIDPAFLLIYILKFIQREDSSQFRPADDIFEDVALKLEATMSTSKDPSHHVSSKDVRTFTSLQCCKDALGRICEVEHVTSEIVVYRFSSDKAVQYLRKKVERLSKPEVVETSRILTRNLAKDGLMEDDKEELLELGRTKTACDLVSQYLTPEFRSLLMASFDFERLDGYLQKLEEEKMCVDAPAPGAKKVAKKESKTESANTDNKRKKGAAKGSHGVEQLKKANLNGMAKLSTFFAKKT